MEQKMSGVETGAEVEPEVEMQNETVASKFVRRERRLDFAKELEKCSEKEEDFQMTKSAAKSERDVTQESSRAITEERSSPTENDEGVIPVASTSGPEKFDMRSNLS